MLEGVVLVAAVVDGVVAEGVVKGSGFLGELVEVVVGVGGGISA